LWITYDNDSEQLEILAAIMEHLKGRCDYLSSAEEAFQRLYEKLSDKWPTRN
jgi:hypothetical protein